jgi:hypothetical protein
MREWSKVGGEHSEYSVINRPQSCKSRVERVEENIFRVESSSTFLNIFVNIFFKKVVNYNK